MINRVVLRIGLEVQNSEVMKTWNLTCVRFRYLVQPSIGKVVWGTAVYGPYGGAGGWAAYNSRTRTSWAGVPSMDHTVVAATSSAGDSGF